MAIREGQNRGFFTVKSTGSAKKCVVVGYGYLERIETNCSRVRIDQDESLFWSHNLRNPFVKEKGRRGVELFLPAVQIIIH
jgi:hypothetical protein